MVASLCRWDMKPMRACRHLLAQHVQRRHPQHCQPRPAASFPKPAAGTLAVRLEAELLLRCRGCCCALCRLQLLLLLLLNDMFRLQEAHDAIYVVRVKLQMWGMQQKVEQHGKLQGCSSKPSCPGLAVPTCGRCVGANIGSIASAAFCTGGMPITTCSLLATSSSALQVVNKRKL